MPNSGRCESAYLFVDLYVVNGGGDRQLSGAVRIEGRANAESARPTGVPTTKVVTHRYPVPGGDARDMIADGQELTS
jgi:hypothetical protein